MGLLKALALAGALKGILTDEKGTAVGGVTTGESMQTKKKVRRTYGKGPSSRGHK